MAIKIHDLEFKTQTALHKYIDGIRTIDDDEEFQRVANSSENSALLIAVLNGRPTKQAELAGRRVISWGRRKRGGRWSFDAILDDGARLDMGVSKTDISEFVRNQLQG